MSVHTAAVSLQHNIDAPTGSIVIFPIEFPVADQHIVVWVQPNMLRFIANRIPTAIDGFKIKVEQMPELSAQNCI